jgi:hypothetical protein
MTIFKYCQPVQIQSKHHLGGGECQYISTYDTLQFYLDCASTYISVVLSIKVTSRLVWSSPLRSSLQIWPTKFTSTNSSSQRSLRFVTSKFIVLSYCGFVRGPCITCAISQGMCTYHDHMMHIGHMNIVICYIRRILFIKITWYISKLVLIFMWPIGELPTDIDNSKIIFEQNHPNPCESNFRFEFYK